MIWNNLNKENGDVTHWNGGLTGNRSNLLQLKFGLVKQLGMLPNGDFEEKSDRLIDHGILQYAWSSDNPTEKRLFQIIAAYIMHIYIYTPRNAIPALLCQKAIFSMLRRSSRSDFAIIFWATSLDHRYVWTTLGKDVHYKPGAMSWNLGSFLYHWDIIWKMGVFNGV